MQRILKNIWSRNMSKWYEFQFLIKNNNISQTFKEINSFLKNKKIKHNFFFIIKRPNIFLRIKDYKGKDFIRFYEPEIFQFGGNSNWNIIFKYLNQISASKLTDDWSKEKTEIFAINFLYTILYNQNHYTKCSILKQLKYARASSGVLTQKFTTSKKVLNDAYILVEHLSKVKNALFPLDKVLPFVLIFCYNIADVPKYVQIYVISYFEKEYYDKRY